MIPNSTKSTSRDIPFAFTRRVFVGGLLSALILPGCAHLGVRMAQVPLPAGAPTAEDILRDLAANDNAIRNFRASGSVSLSSPELSGIKRFRDSSISFRRPDRLYAIGRKHLGPVLLRLTCVGEEFLLEVPTENEYYYQLHGEQFSSVPFSVSPSDIAREMFLPEPWEKVKPRHIRITGYDADKRTATLELLEGAIRPRPKRRIEVQQFPPWVITRNELLDRHGNTLAITTRSDYHELDGVRFAATVDAVFPTEQTEMKFEMHRVQANTDLDESVFDIAARARELKLDLRKLADENAQAGGKL